MRSENLAVTLALAAALMLAGCLGDKPRPAGGCKSVNTACVNDSECCSFGCIAGVCACNPYADRGGNDGIFESEGVCKESSDCCAGDCTDNTCVFQCRNQGQSCNNSRDCCDVDGKITICSNDKCSVF